MTNPTLHTLADRLQYIIELRNLSHNDVARLCGIKQGSVSYILAKNLDRSKLAYEMAKGLNVSYDWLTTGRGTMRPQSIHQIPLFDNVFDGIKYTQSQDIESVQSFVYSEKDELAQETFAYNINDKVTLICLFSQDSPHHCGLFLNVTNILLGEVELSKTPTHDAYYPVAELRINELSETDKLKLMSFSI